MLDPEQEIAGADRDERPALAEERLGPGERATCDVRWVTSRASRSARHPSRYSRRVQAIGFPETLVEQTLFPSHDGVILDGEQDQDRRQQPYKARAQCEPRP